MRYFVMDSKYEWVRVCKECYDNIPDDMIDNKCKVSKHGFVTIDVDNITSDQLLACLRLCGISV